MPRVRRSPTVAKPITVAITKQQVAGVKVRQDQVDVATAQLARAEATLNEFLSGVVAGHGYDAVNVTAFDDEKRTITIVPSPKPPE